MRKHLASVWPRREQKSHLERPEAVEVELGVEDVFGEVERVLKRSLEGFDCQNAISKGPFSHRGHKGTAEEDIRLY